MPISGDATRSLTTALANQGAAKEIIAAIGATGVSPASAIAAIGTTTAITSVPGAFGSASAIGATTPIDAVPGTFADVAAVQTYLAGANQLTNVETRLAALETQGDALVAAVAAVQTYLAGTNAIPRVNSRLGVIEAKVDALLAAIKASGLMAGS